MKKYAKICIKTTKTYAMTAEEARSQDGGVKIENDIYLLENPNLTAKKCAILADFKQRLSGWKKKDERGLYLRYFRGHLWGRYAKKIYVLLRS